jgi:AhpD family alkylhydroperoxidase
MSFSERSRLGLSQCRVPSKAMSGTSSAVSISSAPGSKAGPTSSPERTALSTDQQAGSAAAQPLVHVIEADQAPLLAKAFFGGGDPGPITATMAHVPDLVEVALPFLGTILSPTNIDFRTKEIVILRTSALLACRYCVDSHTTVALDAGLSTEEAHALRNESSTITTTFSDPRELALLGWIDAVATGTGRVAPATRTEMGKQFAEHEIVELTVLIGATMLLNRYASALELPVGADTIIRLAAEGFERFP